MILQSLKMAWESIRANKMRSFLTMLGIIIGVFSLVVLVSIVSGATGSITDSISSMGSNSLTVTVVDDNGRSLKYEDLMDIEKSSHVASVSPYVTSMGTIKSRHNSESGSIYGVNGSYAGIAQTELAAGRNITDTDYRNNSYVAVVSQEVIEDILGTRDPAQALGEQISVSGHPLMIVGVIKEAENSQQNAQMFGMSVYSIYIPYTALVRLTDLGSGINAFMVSAEGDLKTAQSEVGDWLTDRFGDEDSFYIVNFEEVMNILGDVTSTLSLVMGGVAAISLLVGGIGIMNIMLVSVTERTKEIGIRKAIGAGRGSILLQFLIEAMMISVIGCFIGVALSGAVLKIISDVWGKIQFGLEPGVVVLATVFSLAIGVIFGLYPANKAARKNPIDALHYAG